MSLKGFQRSYLRALAHALKPIVIVGDGGVTEGVIKATQEALLQHELIKVRMHEPKDKKADAAALAEGTGAEVCGLVGHTVILYKRHPKEPKVHVPTKG